MAAVFLLFVAEMLSAEGGDPDLFCLMFLMDSLVALRGVDLGGSRSI